MAETLFVTDLDGTLLGPDGLVPPRTAEILRPLIEEGLPLTVATARSPATVVSLLAPLRLRLPVVLMTGAMLYDLANTRCLGTRHIDPHTVQAVCALLEESGAEALVYCVQQSHLNVYYRQVNSNTARHFIDQRSHSPYKRFVHTDSYTRAIEGGDVLLFMLPLEDEEQTRALWKRFLAMPGLTCYCYSDEYGNGYVLELYPVGCTKAAAVEKIKALCGASRVVAFGDNVNDIPLFEAADESCAVANAMAAVRQAATRVIGANTQDGVAHWLAEHWREYP